MEPKAFSNMTTPNVMPLERAELRVAKGPWAFAITEADRIRQHWQQRSAANPVFFNGRIYLCSSIAVDNGVLAAQFLETDFASYLYWRETGYPDPSMRDAFGSALLRSAEGSLMLGVQRSGNVNAGLALMPGGFFDARDIGPDGIIDLDGSIARELLEETGLGPAEFAREPGYLMIDASPQISIAATFRSHLPAATLQQRVRANLARDADPELGDLIAIGSAADAALHPMPRHIEFLVDRLFDENQG